MKLCNRKFEFRISATATSPFHSPDSNNGARSQIHEIQLRGVPVAVRNAVEHVRLFQCDVLVDDQFVFVQSIDDFGVFHEM